MTSKLDGLIITPPLSDMDEFLHDLDSENIEYSIIAVEKESLRDYDASEMTAKIIEYGHKQIGFVKGHKMHSASKSKV